MINELVQYNYFRDRGLNAEDFKPLVDDLQLSAAQLERAAQLQLVPIPGLPGDLAGSKLVSEFFALQVIRLLLTTYYLLLTTYYLLLTTYHLLLTTHYLPLTTYYLSSSLSRSSAD